MKAHLQWEAARERGIPRHVWGGNRRADELVGLGAAAHAVRCRKRSGPSGHAPSFGWSMPCAWPPVWIRRSPRLRRKGRRAGARRAAAARKGQQPWPHCLGRRVLHWPLRSAGPPERDGLGGGPLVLRPWSPRPCRLACRPTESLGGAGHRGPSMTRRWMGSALSAPSAGGAP